MLCHRVIDKGKQYQLRIKKLMEICNMSNLHVFTTVCPPGRRLVFYREMLLSKLRFI